MRSYVGVDLSLTSTGLAAITVPGIEAVPAAASVTRVTSTGSTKDSLRQRQARLVQVGMQVVGFVDRMDPRLVVIEAPSFASKYGHPHDRSGLWWLVVNALLANGHQVASAPPTTRAKYAAGKGNASKDQVLAEVVRRYPDVTITKNDEADALVLAAMGARQLGDPIEASLPVVNITALSGVEWPF